MQIKYFCPRNTEALSLDIKCKLVAVEEGKPENLEKKSSEQSDNQQQTQPIYNTGSIIQSWMEE